MEIDGVGQLVAPSLDQLVLYLLLVQQVAERSR